MKPSVTLGNIVQHVDDLGAGALEDPMAHIALNTHAVAQKVTLPTGTGSNGGNGQFGGAPTVPAYGSGGGSLTSPGAHVTWQLLQSLQDPANGGVLSQCMMLLLKDAIENRLGAKKEALQAGLAKVGNALASAANEALQSQHERADLESKAATEMTGFTLGLVAGGIQAVGSVASFAGGGPVTSGLKELGTAASTVNGAFDKLLEAHKDEIELNSATWADKARSAHLEVLKTITENDSQSTQAAVEDATDALRNARDMVSKIWQAKKDNMDKAKII
jgi:hypothetical protein